MEDVVDYIKYLMKNENAYMKHFQWRKKSLIRLNPQYRELLELSRKRKSETGLNELIGYCDLCNYVASDIGKHREL
jgi:hypothetical protein